MPDPTTSAAPVTLWLTDRTRSKTGLGRCQRKRYLSAHFGPTGYGITTRSESLPLATGLAVHEGLGDFDFATLLQTTDQLPTAEQTREVVARAVARYRAKVEARGFLGMLKGPTTDEIIDEQATLIAGLIWALRLKFLPWFHQSYQVVSAERERLHFLSCTCGAGPMDASQHVARGCQGIALMLRRDLLAERRGAGTLAYFEAKTTGWESDAWSEQWETDPQLALGTLDAPIEFGREVTELYILGIGKGSRRRDKYKDGGAGRKKQMSALCYGSCRPGNPPLAADDWLPAYEWQTESGETKRASRAHKRRGIWELGASDWPTWVAYHQQDPAMTPAEFWVRMLPASVLDKVCFLIGPMNRQDQQLASLRRSMRADEERWQETLWNLYQAQQPQPASDAPGITLSAMSWDSPAFQRLLDDLVPCSWQCRPFGKEHQCEFVPICHRDQGWQDPLGSGRYVPRRPHHAPELDQAVARGLLPEQAEEAVDEEERS